MEPLDRKKNNLSKVEDSSEEEEGKTQFSSKYWSNLSNVQLCWFYAHQQILFPDDEDRIREELKDLIDDGPVEESEGEDSDASRGAKRKKSDDEELDDRLEDEDYDLIEENLGVKVDRRVS